MRNYIIRRLFQTIPVLFFVSSIVFLTLHLSGDPVKIMFARTPGFTQEMIENARRNLGLDQPLYVQYFTWISGVLQGDFGFSYLNKMPVSTILMQRLPASIELAVVSLFLAILVAIPGGIVTALKRGTVIDHVVTAIVTAGIAFPGFWLGILVVLLFAVRLNWLPSNGYVEFTRDPIGNLRFLILPALTMTIILAAPIMRFLRSSMLDVMGEDYILVARAKGLKERTVIYLHALKNALIPTITVIGMQFGTMIGGMVMIEWVFAWRGVGWLIVTSILKRDYMVVMGGVLVVATIFVLVNLVVDILYGVLDPRIRYK
ncbi:MAG: ABC transporter permease [Chloroflexota bacterium]|nr:ABC transporter permease [Chloroflexota bacterium]